MLSTTTVRASYQGSGSAGPFSYPFKIFAAADLAVQKTGSTGLITALAYPVDYSVAGVGDAAGGSITLAIALATGESLAILRATPLTQPTAFRTLGTFFSASHEDAFDRVTMQMQQHQDQLDRSFRMNETFDPASLSLELIPETGKVLAWQSPTELGNSTVDTTGIVLPGQGRTDGTTSAFLMNNAVYSVKSYGAKADGTTDDAPAIQAAVNAAAAAGGGQVLLLPGTYLIRTTLSVGSGVVIVGSGRTGTTITNGTAGFAVTFAAAARGSIIQGLHIIGLAGSTGGIKLSADFGHIQLLDLFIEPTAGAAVDCTAGNGIDLYMRDVRAQGGTGSTLFDFSVTGTGVNNVTCVNCYANGAGTVSVGFAFNSVACGTLIGCSADSCTSKGYSLAGGCTLIGCTVESSGTVGFSFDGSTGTAVLINPIATNQGFPFAIGGTNAVTLISPRSTGTPSGPAVLVAASATGDNMILGESLDAAVQINAGGVLRFPGRGLAAVTPAALANGSTNNYAPGLYVGNLRLTADAGGSALTGIVAPPLYSTQLRLTKVGGGTFTLTNEDGGSAASNRIITGTGATITVAVYADLEYDFTVSSRWRVAGFR